jgi:ATP-dependent Clp endopeptidase proteolytic subunit ClpP
VSNRDEHAHRQQMQAALRDGPKPWYRFENRSKSEADVYIYDAIGGWFGVSSGEFVKELRDLDVDRITVHINSPGGDAFDGIAILNTLRSHKASITTVVEGLAASAASYIAMGGDEVVMADNSEMMIHDASGLCFGTAADMEWTRDALNKLSDNIAAIYADKAGGSAEMWRDVMRAETWYSAQEAVDAGLADRVDRGKDDAGAAKNRFDLSFFAYAGRAKAPAPKTPAASGSTTPPEGSPTVAFTDEQIQTMRQKLGVKDDADEATILGALDEALQEAADGKPAASADDATWKNEAARLSSELAETKAELAGIKATDARKAKAAFFAEMTGSGRLKPADRAELEQRYDEAPQVVQAIVSARAPGSEVPLAEIGYGDGTSDETGDVRETPTYKNWRMS